MNFSFVWGGVLAAVALGLVAGSRVACAPLMRGLVLALGVVVIFGAVWDVRGAGVLLLLLGAAGAGFAAGSRKPRR